MTDNLTLNMDAYLPLRDVVFNTLREAILKGELKPGERLMELQLASKLESAVHLYVKQSECLSRRGLQSQCRERAQRLPR